MSRTIVYAGPSVAHCAVDTLLERFEVRPPIRRGDLPQLLATSVDGDPVGCVAIIDGELAQSLSVSVTEIRDALQAGVDIVGASSMGALRAVECAVLGMRGVGWVYKQYRDGAIEADDEVALLFDPGTGVPLTVPLVNVRWGAQCLVGVGSLSAAVGQELVTTAASLHFTERTFRAMAAVACGSGCAEAVQLLAAATASDPAAWDRKYLDAARLLAELPASTEMTDAAS